MMIILQKVFTKKQLNEKHVGVLIILSRWWGLAIASVTFIFLLDDSIDHLVYLIHEQQGHFGLSNRSDTDLNLIDLMVDALQKLILGALRLD